MYRHLETDEALASLHDEHSRRQHAASAGTGLGHIFPGVDEAVLLAPTACPLQCGATLLGKDVDHHVRRECPRRPGGCPYGCGERVLAADLDNHRTVCPMALVLDRAERALRESAVKELRLALAEAYEERNRAHARLCVRGEASFRDRPDWASEGCAARVLNLETGKREMTVRARRRAAERLVSALAQGSAERPAGAAAGAPLSALRLWDALQAPVVPHRSARPWDAEGPALQPLLEALEEAAACAADEDLRRRGEKMLLAGVRRLLEASLQTIGDDRRTTLEESLERARVAMTLVELEDPGDLPVLVQKVDQEAHQAALMDIPASAPEFYEALTAGDVDLCRWLLDREQANPSRPDPSSRLTPLIIAAKTGDLPMCRLMLESHADVNGRSEVDGLSALHWAAHQRYARVVALLLESRANPRLQDKRGQDALMKLVRRDFTSPPAGCAWSWEVEEGRRLKSRQLQSPGDFRSVEDAMLAAEADPNCVGFCVCLVDDRVILHGAGQAESHTFEEDDCWTAYLKVAMHPTDDLRRLLLAGADACAADLGGLTVLHHHLLSAPSRGSPAAVEALLRGFADVNRRDRTERSTTPLLLAVASRRADLVQLMLKEAWPPADVDSRTADGTSALALAEASGAHKVAGLLRSAGASAWAEAEVRLGSRTTFTFDTRTAPVPA